MLDKKKILVLNGQYIPGYKGGGPIQSCVNMIENLSDKFDFYVLTSDRDFKSREAYKKIKINDWNQVGSAKVYYMSPETQTIKGFEKLLNNTEYDIMYLNGFFSPIFTIKPLLLRWLGKLKNKKIIITPRGDFTGGCENKKIKKYMYIYICKIIGLYNDLLWHATSDLEEFDIKKKFKGTKSFVIPNLSAKYTESDTILKKKSGELKLVFISRIFPKKNLKFAMEVLRKIKRGNIIFDIYGPMEDHEYWGECKKIMKELPSNIEVNYKGEVPHSEVAHIFQNYHAFFFPTLGENYGHVIVEAMMNNCITIFSSGVTPWDEYGRILRTSANLKNPEEFINIIYSLLNKSDKDYKELINLNNKYVEQILDNSLLIDEYIDCFNSFV